MKNQAQTLRFAPALPALFQGVIQSVSATLAARRARREREAAAEALYSNPGFIAEFGHVLPEKEAAVNHLAKMTPAVLAAGVHSLPRDGAR